MPFRIFIILTFVTIGRPQDIFPFLIPFRLALIFTFGSLLSTFIGMSGTSFKSIFKMEESKKIISIFVIMIIGIPFAFHKGLAFNFVFKIYLFNVLYFFLFITHVRSFNRLKTVLFTLCFSALMYSSFSMLQGSMSPGGRLLAGVMFDPNDIAFFFVSLLPISFFFIFISDGRIKKILACVTVIFSIIVILMTGSRGGFLGLIAVLSLLFFTNRGGLKKIYRAFLIIALLLIFVSSVDKVDTERFKSILDLKNDYNITAKMGRLDIWKTALSFLISNPLTGVGVNCFEFAIGYKREAAGEIPVWQAPHNSFIQFGTEVGIVGFFFFISLIRSCLKTFSQCRNMKNDGSFSEFTQFRKLGGFLQIAFIGHLICTFFLSQAYSPLLTIFFGLSAVMGSIYIDYGGADQQKHP